MSTRVINDDSQFKGEVRLVGASGHAIFDPSTLTGARTHGLPDIDGNFVADTQAERDATTITDSGVDGNITITPADGPVQTWTPTAGTTMAVTAVNGFVSADFGAITLIVKNAVTNVSGGVTFPAGFWYGDPPTLTDDMVIEIVSEPGSTDGRGVALDGSAIPSATDLGYTASSTDGTVTSSSGTNATLPLADGVNAGLLAPADFDKLALTSGTNSGDQTITLTGDVTGSGTGSFAATIAADSVTYAKMQNVASDQVLLGNDNGAAQDVQELTASEVRTLLNVEDGATADQTGAEIKTAYESEPDTNAYTDAEKTKVGHLTVTGAVNLDTINTRVNELDAAVILSGTWDASVGTFPGGGTAQAGESYIVSVAGTVDSVAFAINDRIIAILDNASTTTYASNWHKADYTDQVLSVNTQTGAVVLDADDIDDSATAHKFVTASDVTNLGNLSGTNSGDQTITLTGDVTGSGTGSFAATIANDSVTYAKLQNVAADQVLLGNDNGAAQDVQELTASEVRTLLNVEDGADVTDAANVASSGAVMADGTGNDITGDLVFTEKADHSSTPGAGKGYLWTKNTVPSTLIFTDDTGADTTLGSGGGVAVGDSPAWTGAHDYSGATVEGVQEVITSPTQTTAGSDGNVLQLTGANSWGVANASAVGTAKGLLGIRLANGEVQISGQWTTSGLTPGAEYYLSSSAEGISVAGGITTTKPAAAGAIVRLVGYALNTTTLILDVDKTYIEVQ